jgi:polyisoprenoid-binding protein YceI
MQPRSTSFAAVAAALTALLSAAALQAETLTVDAAHSTILFRVKHLNTSLAWGRFNEMSGVWKLDGETPQVEVTIKANSVDTANEQRDQHLTGPDFFNSKLFPTISFKSSKVAKGSDGKIHLDGTLSLHGAEKPLSLELVKTGAGLSMTGGKIVGYETTFKIKRSDFGMKFLVGPLGDEVLIVAAFELGVK